ncbi:hypothetical protein E4T56_gene5909 [Termitomyces sp. T112]|nr:hypothetical protein E4T56_gene5909 [Termitomyces sp. T112]
MLPTSILFISVALTSYVMATAPGSVHQLLRRQIDPNTIPPVCADRCAETVMATNDCTVSSGPTCICSLDVESHDVDCFNCLLFDTGATPDASTVRTIQADLDEYVEACASAGVRLPATTVSGGVSGLTTSISIAAQQTITVNPSIVAPTGLILTTSAPITTSTSGTGGLKKSSGNKNDASAIAVAVAAVLGFFF